jgi:hypothetical protein
VVLFVVLMIGLAVAGAVLSGIWDIRRDEARMVRFQPAVHQTRAPVRQLSRRAYESAAGQELMAEIEEWLHRQR